MDNFFRNTAGNTIIKKAFKKEAIFQGLYLENIPDIIIELNERYESGAGLAEDEERRRALKALGYMD